MTKGRCGDGPCCVATRWDAGLIGPAGALVPAVPDHTCAAWDPDTGRPRRNCARVIGAGLCDAACKQIKAVPHSRAALRPRQIEDALRGAVLIQGNRARKHTAENTGLCPDRSRRCRAMLIIALQHLGAPGRALYRGCTPPDRPDQPRIRFNHRGGPGIWVWPLVGTSMARPPKWSDPGPKASTRLGSAPVPMEKGRR